MGLRFKNNPKDLYQSFSKTILKIYSILNYPIILEGRRGTKDEFATIPFHLVLFSAALAELANSIPVHSLILLSPIPTSSVCRFVFVLSLCPVGLSLLNQKTLKRGQTILVSASGPGSGVHHILQCCLDLLRTSSLVIWSLYEMFNNLR